MNRLLIASATMDDLASLASDLKAEGFFPQLVPSLQTASEYLSADSVDMVLLHLEPFANDKPALTNLIKLCKERGNIPIVGLIGLDTEYDFAIGIDDFMVLPCNPREVVLRLRQILWRTRGIDGRERLKYGDLVLDLARYEVSLQGKRVDLTFKEYELLKFLASSPGRVFTREVLLDRVWGYDYLGGTRTVDVHIRRLRSKIEDATHAFIDTVRNVGYKFKENE